MFAFIPSNSLHIIIALLGEGVANNGWMIKGKICKGLKGQLVYMRLSYK